MKDTFIFKRVEKKYILSNEKKEQLMAELQGGLTPDRHGKSTVCSLYLDTPDFLLIRNSIEGKVYKEKLRVRSYGVPSNTSKVFFEIKKKYKGVVYKRRVSMKYFEMLEYLSSGKKPFTGQIMNEIDWAMKYYKDPVPRVLICYEREAYTFTDDDSVRITFDTNVRYRTQDLVPEGGTDGKKIISDDTVIMEIKTSGGMPVSLSHALDKLCIYPSRFSKYGTAYREFDIDDTNIRINNKI